MCSQFFVSADKRRKKGSKLKFRVNCYPTLPHQAVQPCDGQEGKGKNR